MIGFFRRIRKKLVDDNQFLKYTRYAIGEIVLVVVGILIALQINNYNDARKQEKMVIQILNEILEEIDINLNDSKNAIISYHKKDSLINLVMNDKLTYDASGDEYSSFMMRNIVRNYRDFEILDNGFGRLMENSDKVPNKYQSIVNELKDLFGNKKEVINNLNSKVSDVVLESENYLMEKYDWYPNLYNNKSFDEYITYQLTDPMFKSFVFRYHTAAIMELMQEIIIFYQKAQDISRKLTRLLDIDKAFVNTMNIKEYEYLLGSFKMNNLKESSIRWVIMQEGGKLFMIMNDKKNELYFIGNDLFLLSNRPGLYSIRKTNEGKIIGFLWRLGSFTNYWIKVD